MSSEDRKEGKLFFIDYVVSRILGRILLPVLLNLGIWLKGNKISNEELVGSKHADQMQNLEEYTSSRNGP